MNKILKYLLFVISLSSFAQTKYSSLNNACEKNASNSGVSNNGVTIYIANFSNNDYAFVSSDNNNYKRLKRGYYYHKSQNSAFQVNVRGRITEIQTCANAQPGEYPNSPSDANHGIAGTGTATDYDIIKNEMSNGSTRFDFYGNSNGQAYPTGLRNGNGYETMSFPSHSITQKTELAGLISMCRYKITDSQGKVVIFVEDTRGGFHPCINGTDCNTNLRSNNHPDDCNRYLAEGTYTIEYSNITNHSTNMAQKLQLWYQDQNTIDKKIDQVVNNGETVTKTFTISGTGSTPNAFYKLNSNVF